MVIGAACEPAEVPLDFILLHWRWQWRVWRDITRTRPWALQCDMCGSNEQATEWAMKISGETTRSCLLDYCFGERVLCNLRSNNRNVHGSSCAEIAGWSFQRLHGLLCLPRMPSAVLRWSLRTPARVHRGEDASAHFEILKSWMNLVLGNTFQGKAPQCFPHHSVLDLVWKHWARLWLSPPPFW